MYWTCRVHFVSEVELIIKFLGYLFIYVELSTLSPESISVPGIPSPESQVGLPGRQWKKTRYL